MTIEYGCRGILFINKFFVKTLSFFCDGRIYQKNPPFGFFLCFYKIKLKIQIKYNRIRLERTGMSVRGLHKPTKVGVKKTTLYPSGTRRRCVFYIPQPRGRGAVSVYNRVSRRLTGSVFW